MIEAAPLSAKKIKRYLAIQMAIHLANNQASKSINHLQLYF